MPPADSLAVLDAIEPARIPAAIAHLSARLLTLPAAPTEDEDFSLTVADAAKLLRVSPRHIYRHAQSLGGRRVSKRKLRFSRAAITRHLQRSHT